MCGCSIGGYWGTSLHYLREVPNNRGAMKRGAGGRVLQTEGYKILLYLLLEELDLEVIN